MKYVLFKNSINKKILSLLIVICFLTTIANQCIADPDPVKDPLCYGFIVSLVECENETLENQINCRMKHMINDLLREQISVYWMATDVNTTVREITDDENETEMFFEKGSFIISFTGNDTLDAKLIAIIYDYNQSSEIEENITIKIPVYELTESLNMEVYPLSEVKIAYITIPSSTGLSYYVEKAGKCGLLNFDFLEDEELQNKLNNSVYNVVVLAAVPTANLLSYYLETVVRDLRYKTSKLIREFVSNGGGYIGSCFGSYRASSGVLPFPAYFIRKAHNSNLRSFGVFAISDTLTSMSFRTLGPVQIRIADNNHPLTYGLDPIVGGFNVNGPRFVHIGKNSQVVARFHNCTRYLDGTRCFLSDSPIWVSSTFDLGKVILFSGHPEMIDKDDHTEALEIGDDIGTGKKIISNALFYTTSKEVAELETVESRNLSFITDIQEKTMNL